MPRVRCSTMTPEGSFSVVGAAAIAVEERTAAASKATIDFKASLQWGGASHCNGSYVAYFCRALPVARIDKEHAPLIAVALLACRASVNRESIQTLYRIAAGNNVAARVEIREDCFPFAGVGQQRRIE